MAALADELARLVSALHGTGSNENCLGWAKAGYIGEPPRRVNETPVEAAGLAKGDREHMA